MVNLQTAEQALKNVYLGVVSEQLNVGVNPFLAKIQQTSADVWGNNIVKLATYGLNGGVGAGSETGDLPTSAGNNYAQFNLELKNLYGTIKISDKAIKASQNGNGAFVNLLNAEMEGLLTASKFNLGRMLYGNGSGKLAVISTSGSSGSTIKLNSVKNVMEGMVIDILKGADNSAYSGLSGKRITIVDRANKTIKIDGTCSQVFADGDYITVQNSYNKELTGLGAIFSDDNIYGLTRNAHLWLKPYMKNDCGNMSIDVVQSAIDYIDEVAGSGIDFIVCAYDVKRYYLNYLNANRTNIDYMELDGGYKSLCYNGVPLIADRFVEDGDMYMLNSSDFKLHQLGDWRWLEGEGGNVIKQIAGTPTYSATLVKYAELICDKPIGQAKLSGIIG